MSRAVSLSNLNNELLLYIDQLARSGNIRTTKPKKNHWYVPASKHNLRNLPLMPGEFERLVRELNQQLESAGRGNHGLRPAGHIIEVHNESGYHPSHRRTLERELKKFGIYRGVASNLPGKPRFVRASYSLAPLSRRFRNLPRKGNAKPKRARSASPTPKRARSASPTRRRARARGNFSI